MYLHTVFNYSLYLFKATKKLDTSVDDHLFKVSVESLMPDCSNRSTSSNKLCNIGNKYNQNSAVNSFIDDQ